MRFLPIVRSSPVFSFLVCVLAAAALAGGAGIVDAQAQGRSPGGSSSPSSSQSSSSNSQPPAPGQLYTQERAPLIDPAGPTISLISAEPVFMMAAALNTCGYDEGLDQSAPVRKRVRDEINQALQKSEDARAARDKLCLYIAQHRLTGSQLDIAQYISLSLYLTPPPELETTVQLAEMPPDATQVADVVPLLKAFAQATDLHGIWLTVHLVYDQVAEQVHDPLSQMIVNANLYLKMPASTYQGTRFVVVIEPMYSPSMVNARIYGSDYVVLVSPVDGKIPLTAVRHTYLHYVIDPLLLARTNAIDRTQPILKEIRDAPLEFRFRSDTVSLTIECLIKAIEARTMDTGVPIYKVPANVDRSQLPKFERERQLSLDKAEAVRVAAVQHDMNQGFVLTQYFYDQMLAFEKDPASLKDTIGEMVYSMDVDQQVHRARNTTFDKQADEDILQRYQPRKLAGLDLAEARLSTGDVNGASAIAQKVLAGGADSAQSQADDARAHFILARVDLMSFHAGETEDEAEKSIDNAVDQFQKTLAASKDQRLLAWSHIYLGRVLDLECKRDEAVAEYNQALAVRDWQQDTRLAAERGVKTAYATPGHEHACDDAPADTGGDANAAPDAGAAPKPDESNAAQDKNKAQKPQR
jgi:tetratricopeptide (TPR) repeat protein